MCWRRALANLKYLFISALVSKLFTASRSSHKQLAKHHKCENSLIVPLQVRLQDKETAQQRVQALEIDNTELSQRLVEMKMTEIERMNEVNRVCDEMMRNARSMERAAAADASSRSRQVFSKIFGPNARDGSKVPHLTKSSVSQQQLVTGISELQSLLLHCSYK